MVADSRSVSASSYDKNCNKNESMISSLLNRLNTGLCLCSQPVDDVEYEFDLNLDQIDATERKLEEIMKELLIDIDLQEGGARPSSSIGNASLILDDKITALNTLYQLSSVKSNRIPIVCTSKWDIMGSLVNCLMIDETQNSIQLRHEKIRQLACLILNNLSIPKENKSIMILGCHATPLLRNLTRMIRTQEPETSYLCCICLMNLSFLSDGVEPIMTFSPQSDNDAHQGMSIPSIGRNSIDSRDWEKFPTSMLRPTRAPTPPRQRRSNAPSPYLDDPNSLLLSLESLMRDHQPFLMSKAYSVEGEAIRWSVGLLRNLTKKNKHCSIIAKTEIPALFLGFLDKTPHPATKWTKDTIEDMSLTALDQLAGSPDSCEKLRQIGAICIVQNIKLGASKTQVDRKISSILKSLEQ